MIRFVLISNKKTMRKLNPTPTFLIIVVFVLFIVQCKKDDDPVSPNFVVAQGFGDTDASIRYSENGTSWPINYVSPISQNYQINALAYGDNHFIGVGGGIYSHQSENGIDWEFTHLDSIVNYNDIAYGEYHDKSPWLPYFVAVGEQGAVMYTYDNGNSWTKGASGVSTTLNAVTYAYTSQGLSMFVAVGSCPSGLSPKDNPNQSIIIYSLTAGETWINHSTGGTSRDLYCVAYGNGRFIAAGKDGVMLYSTNGAAWYLLESNTYKDIYGLCYGIVNNSPLWVAVGETGTILYSQDNGNTWTAADFNPYGDNYYTMWQDVICRNNKVYAVGYGQDASYGFEGKIIYSGDGINWQFSATFAGQENYGRDIAVK
jgi:hypothetical protein